MVMPTDIKVIKLGIGQIKSPYFVPISQKNAPLITFLLISMSGKHDKLATINGVNCAI
jgi:hypothetical protein